MSIFLLHARHNKEAFTYLNDHGGFPDWTITTAFYCAMHYCHAILFPLIENGIEYGNVEHYYNDNKRVGDTKHGLTLRLIRQHHALIAEKYKLLKDVAHTSRYQDYNLPNVIVSKVKRNMKAIEDYCEALIASRTLPTSTTS